MEPLLENLSYYLCGCENPEDSNGIYNNLTRVLPHTFDQLLSRVNKYARVEDDEMAVGIDQGKKQGAVEEMAMASLIRPR